MAFQWEWTFLLTALKLRKSLNCTFKIRGLGFSEGYSGIISSLSLLSFPFLGGRLLQFFSPVFLFFFLMRLVRFPLMFVPYRTVGLVCSGSQQYVSHLGSESFLITSIGKGFQVWRCDHLSLSLVSSQVESLLTCVAPTLIAVLFCYIFSPVKTRITYFYPHLTPHYLMA